MSCFFGHKWKAKAVEYAIETPRWAFDQGERKGLNKTIILYVCRECGTHETEVKDGKWTLEQLKV